MSFYRYFGYRESGALELCKVADGLKPCLFGTCCSTITLWYIEYAIGLAVPTVGVECPTPYLHLTGPSSLAIVPDIFCNLQCLFHVVSVPICAVDVKKDPSILSFVLVV